MASKSAASATLLIALGVDVLLRRSSTHTVHRQCVWGSSQGVQRFCASWTAVNSRTSTSYREESTRDGGVPRRRGAGAATQFWNRRSGGGVDVPRIRNGIGNGGVPSTRSYARLASPAEDRESMEYDVCIVGAGPAGLAASIRLRQLSMERGEELTVCIVDKAPEVGNHILSGNVFEPRALDELLPGWREKHSDDEGFPLRTRVTSDAFCLLVGERMSVQLPTPPSMHNDGNYVASLSGITRWLAVIAENEYGVEIYPGFAASEVLRCEDSGAVLGVATGDVGIAKDGSHKESFERGMELRARITLFAEGCRGSLSQQLMRAFNLRQGVDPQTYALGIKEVWEVPEEVHDEGHVMHSVGWPMQGGTYGGGFLYHMDERRVAVGYVVALDYKNPYLSPYWEFQRFKTHPLVRRVLEGGSVLQYGARTLNEGGLQAIPKLVFPGGALIGCAAGFLNVSKIKGTHTAMKSGMLAAESAFEALVPSEVDGEDTASDASAASAAAGDESEHIVLDAYPTALRESWVYDELYRSRNLRPGFQYGFVAGMINAAIDTYVFGGKAPYTLRHKHPDNEALTAMSDTNVEPIAYPKPDNVLTFDIPTSLYRSGTNHDHDQPAHLRLRNAEVPANVNFAVYGGPEGRYCPARVYEYVEPDASDEVISGDAIDNDATISPSSTERGCAKLVINAQNCLHCKACDIKDPTQNIQWTVPEGGGGPKYTLM